MRIPGGIRRRGRLPQALAAAAAAALGLVSLAVPIGGPLAGGDAWTVGALLAAACSLLAVAVRARAGVSVTAVAACAAAVVALATQAPIGGRLDVLGPIASAAVNRVAALAAILAAVGALGAAWIRRPRRRAIVVVSLGSVIGALVVAGIVNDLFHGSGSVATGVRALAIAALGTSVVLTGRPVGGRERRRLTRWLFLPLAVAVATGAIALAQFMYAREVRELRQVTATTLERATDQLRVKVESSGLGLNRMARAWSWRGQPERNDWKTDAWLFVDHYEEVLAVAWVGPDHEVRWLAPLAGFHELQGMNLAFEERRRSMLERARETRGVAMSEPVELTVGDTGFVVAAPIVVGGEVGGFIVGFYEIAPLLDEILRNVAPGYVVRLMDGEDTVFRSHGTTVAGNSRWHQEGRFELYGTEWRLEIEPARGTVEAELSILPGLTLAIGLGIAVLVGVVVYQGEVARIVALRLGREVRRRSRVQAALRRSQQELESRVAARTADLDEKQRQLEATNAELDRLARTDELTGVWNRRQFLEFAESEFCAAHRYGRSMSVVMFDLDRFKDTNDRHGHHAGDEILRQAAGACASRLRDTDCIARYGGEEFVILLTETARNEAAAVAERMRAALDGLAVEYDGERLGLSASFGVATLAHADDSLDSVLQRADRALYEAKAAGRNRVVFLAA